MLYLYAFATASAPLPKVIGLDNQPVQAIVHGSHAALVSYVEEPPTLASGKQAWMHERVVEAAMAQGTVVPVRFGTVLPDVVTVRRVLRSQAKALAANQRRIAGCAELSLRVMASGNEPAPARSSINPSPMSGTAYLQQRLAALRQEQDAEEQAGAVAVRLVEALKPHARAQTVQTQPSGQLLLHAAFLVPHTELGTFVTLIERLQKQHPDLRLLCTGPWPPYHFVHLPAGAFPSPRIGADLFC